MFELINMLSEAKSRQRSSSGNGRIYDSEIARFLNPDPVIQDPYNFLNYNRYTYCLNNPLKYTDPSGYSYSKMLEEYQSQHYTESATVFYNNYPEEWEDFQRQNSQHYIIQIPTERGKPKISIEIKKTPNYTWGRYEIILRVYGKMYDEYNFMQTKSFEGEVPILDRAWDNNDGFYYNDLDIEYFSNNYYRQGSDGYFEDRPNAFYFDAELTVFGRRNRSWENVFTLAWGYRITNGIYRDYHRLTNPSSTHQEYIRKVINQNNK